MSVLMQVPEGINPGESIGHPLQTGGQFGLWVPCAVIFGYDVIQVTTYHPRAFGVNHEVGKGLSTIIFPAGSA